MSDPLGLCNRPLYMTGIVERCMYSSHFRKTSLRPITLTFRWPEDSAESSAPTNPMTEVTGVRLDPQTQIFRISHAFFSNVTGTDCFLCDSASISSPKYRSLDPSLWWRLGWVWEFIGNLFLVPSLSEIVGMILQQADSKTSTPQLLTLECNRDIWKIQS